MARHGLPSLGWQGIGFADINRDKLHVSQLASQSAGKSVSVSLLASQLSDIRGEAEVKGHKLVPMETVRGAPSGPKIRDKDFWGFNFFRLIDCKQNQILDVWC